MPAIFDSLVNRGLTPHVAWRVSFMVPFVLLISTAIGMLTLCDDTPTGKWSERNQMAVPVAEVQTQGIISDVKDSPAASVAPSTEKTKEHDTEANVDYGTGQTVETDTYRHEVVVKPTWKEMMKVVGSPQTLALAACYFNSFGGELAINSILGAYYLKNFNGELTQTTSGQWAAMFGLVNVFFRPAGGIVGDLLYKYTNGSLWAKKLWLHFVGMYCIIAANLNQRVLSIRLGVMTGVFCLALGLTDPHHLPTMIGLVAGLACNSPFLDRYWLILIEDSFHGCRKRRIIFFGPACASLRQRYRFGNSGCHRQSGRHRLCHHLPLFAPELSSWHLGHWRLLDSYEPYFLRCSADPEDANRREMRRRRC